MGRWWRRCKEQAGARLKTIVGCEINPEEAAKAKARAGSARVEVNVGDFLRWFLCQGERVEAFDAALGNPPFIRYQYLPEEQQELAEKGFPALWAAVHPAVPTHGCLS